MGYWRPAFRRRMYRRAVAAVTAIVAVMIIGMLGFHYIVGLSYIDSFYFESMLATGQGPPSPLTTDSGKIFASVMAFVSVSSVIATLLFTLGPIMMHAWREGVDYVEKEAKSMEHEFVHDKKKEENPEG